MAAPQPPTDALRPVSRPLPRGEVTGWIAPGLEPLLDSFIANFTERGEVGDEAVRDAVRRGVG